MKTVFLDFDGVLFDTLKEAYIVCRYAYYGTDVLKPVEEDIYSLFYRYKFLVYNTGQYYYLMRLLEENIKSGDEFISRYRFYMKNREKPPEEEFNKKYAAKRLDLMKNHLEFWNTLEKPFPFFHEVKKLYEEKRIDIVLVTRKNTFAVKTRLFQYGLNTDKIYGKEELIKYDKKADFINEYMKEHNIKSAYFVDDNSNNLTPCGDYSEIKPLLAGWGNIAPDEAGMECGEIVELLRI